MFAVLPSDERAVAVVAGRARLTVTAKPRGELCSACTAREALSDGFCARCRQARGLTLDGPASRGRPKVGPRQPDDVEISDELVDELCEAVGCSELADPTCPTCGRRLVEFTVEPCDRCQAEAAILRREGELAGKLRWWHAHGNDWRHTRQAAARSS